MEALASHLRITKDPTGTLPFFYPRNLPTLSGTVHHFSQALRKTINEFATTERKKYPSRFSSPETGILFTDDQINKKYPHCQSYLKYLDNTNQKIEHWIHCFDPEADFESDDHRTTTDSYLAGAIYIMLFENQMHSILLLANHMSIQLDYLYLHEISHGGWRGWCQVAQVAIIAYIFINIIAEFPEYLIDKKFETISNLHIWELTIGPKIGEGYADIHKWLYNSKDDIVDYEVIFTDMNRLKEYLKTCFAVLYRTEILARESGKTIPWVDYILVALSPFGISSDYRPWDKEQKEYFYFASLCKEFNRHSYRKVDRET